MPTRKSLSTIYTIQALRAVAALLVVLDHCIYLWLVRVRHKPDANFWMNGAAGVDIFFVISGFVMTVTLGGLAKYAHPIRVFLQRRITRIVPLYWLATTLKVALLIITPGVAVHQSLNWANVLGSYLFWTVPNPEGVPVPVIVQGWTLNFEMLFYVIFSLAMLFKRWTLEVLASLLIILALLNSLKASGSPLILEFLFGAVIARLSLARRLPGALWSWILLGGSSFAILALFPHLPYQAAQVKWRFLMWGVPAAVLVLGAVGLESAIGKQLPKWLISLGDASYAIYLVQTFVLPCVGIAVVRLGLDGGPALAICIVAGMSLTSFAGELVHRFVELPILGKLKNMHQQGAGAVS